MPANIDNYSSELSELVDDFYNNRIEFFEYREQRNILLNQIDDLLNKTEHDRLQEKNENVINKVLSLFVKDDKGVISG